MTRLISFDVGIKNLAYCLLDLSQNSILEWNVLNLCDDPSSTNANTNKITCTQTLQNGKECKQKAKYKYKDQQYACEKHAKSSKQLNIPKPDQKKTTLAKLSVIQLRTLWTNTVGLNQITNKTHPKTKADVLQEILAFYEKTNWELLPKVKKTNAGKVDLVTIGRSLHQQLINNPIMKTVDCVIIENQISPIANRMKTLQGMLAQHYIGLGIPNIEFVSSSNKLKEFAPQSGAKTAYKQHKQDGIFYCEKFLKEQISDHEKWLSQFQKSPKRDDLADCFLQGLWYKRRTLGSSPSSSSSIPN
jgi:hypothetical protein